MSLHAEESIASILSPFVLALRPELICDIIHVFFLK